MLAVVLILMQAFVHELDGLRGSYQVDLGPSNKSSLSIATNLEWNI